MNVWVSVKEVLPTLDDHAILDATATGLVEVTGQDEFRNVGLGRQCERGGTTGHYVSHLHEPVMAPAMAATISGRLVVIGIVGAHRCPVSP